MNQAEFILEEAQRLLEQTGTETEHPRQVRFLARQLFQQLEDLHHLTTSDRIILEAACLLHDIGWSRASKGSAHHKHSSDMIREHPWQSLKAEEQDLLAQVARYHRKSLPKLSHRPFFDLKASARQKVMSMAALIRMADALDRSHRSRVRSLECRLEGAWVEGRGRCLLIVQGGGCLAEEAQALEKKADLFKLHFGLGLDLELLEGVVDTERMLSV
jgi:exopolyphosphatase / guanosine-5'-triphosphate,3'-diphosphate pyrophosphatase